SLSIHQLLFRHYFVGSRFFSICQTGNQIKNGGVILKDILFVERLKLKRTKKWLIYIIGRLLGVLLAYINFYKNYNLFMNTGDKTCVKRLKQVACFIRGYVCMMYVTVKL